MHTRLSILSNKKTLLIKFYFQEYYDELSLATEAVHDGDLIGVMYFNHNFSEALQLRLEDFASATEEVITNGTIDIHLDMSGMYIYFLYYIYFIFISLFIACSKLIFMLTATPC